MLTAQITRPLAQDADTTGEIIDVPDRFIDRYTYLDRADKAVWNAYTQLTVTLGLAGGVTTKLLLDYNAAVADFSTPTKQVFNELNALEGATGQQPVLPPTVEVMSAETDGLGFVPLPLTAMSAVASQAGFVPAANVRFRYGSQSGDLGDALRWAHEHHLQSQALARASDQLRDQLGFSPGIVIVAAIAGIAILAWQIAECYRTKYTSVTQIEAAYADAQRADFQARMTQTVMDAYNSSLRECSRKAKTAEDVTACLDKAGKAAEKAASAVPKLPAPSPRGGEGEGLGFLGWLGLIALAGGAIFAGRWLYLRRKAQAADEDEYESRWRTESNGRQRYARTARG